MIRALLLLLAGPALAQDVDVRFQDGNPYDRFIVFNRGCPLTDFVILLDFTSSAGGVLIDTVSGGPGARDPMAVQLIEGDASLDPVRDGDQMLRLRVASLPNLAALVVTMDVDDSIGLVEEDRVFADGADVAGTTVTITLHDTITTASLDPTGQATLTLPPAAAGCPLS